LSTLQIIANLGQTDWKEWAASALKVQGVDPSNHGASVVKPGETPQRDDAEMLLGVEMIVNTNSIVGLCKKYIEVLSTIDATGSAPVIDEKRYASTDQVVKNVFPRTSDDKNSPVGADGWTGEVWCKPGSTGSVGGVYTSPMPTGRVGLVLGAGNQGVLSITDMLDTLFIHHTVCIVKHHELRYYNKLFFSQVFSPLIEAGYLADVCGGVETGSYLCQHKLVSKVHMTGGTATHDIIVWGMPDQQAENKANNTPVLQKEMSSELGCVTPWILTPAQDGQEWTEAELWHHAKQLYVALTSNNSCNCLSAKVLVIPEEWAQEEDFLSKIKLILGLKQALPAYYPGTLKRWNAFDAAYPEGKKSKVGYMGASDSNEFNATMQRLPLLLVDCEADPKEYALRNEAFSPVLAVVRLPVVASAGESQAEAFLSNAVDFCNQSIWGTLSMTLIAHPSLTPAGSSESDDPVRKAVSRLRYGSIGVNTWTARCFTIEALPWGAFPGETLEDVASGIGFVRNAYMIDHAEKAVCWTPFMSKEHLGNDPVPLTVHRAEGICRFVTQGGLWNLLAMICYPGCCCCCNDSTGVARSGYTN